jgi:environmental stress-induced protein Ves
MKKINSKNLISKKWAGGTTKELFIYPKSSKYELRNFDFRISSATVELEESDFTFLPKYHRILMVLEGSLDIIHKNHHSIHLDEFDIDEFNGAWETKSKGKVTDFNLMTSSKCSGKVCCKKINEKEIIYRNNDEILVYYCFKGNGEINDIMINQGDVIIFELNDENLIEIMSFGYDMVLIESIIKC